MCTKQDQKRKLPRFKNKSIIYLPYGGSLHSPGAYHISSLSVVVEIASICSLLLLKSDLRLSVDYQQLLIQHLFLVENTGQRNLCKKFLLLYFRKECFEVFRCCTIFPIHIFEHRYCLHNYIMT